MNYKCHRQFTSFYAMRAGGGKENETEIRNDYDLIS